jgi:hypothetical protein
MARCSGPNGSTLTVSSSAIGPPPSAARWPAAPGEQTRVWCFTRFAVNVAPVGCSPGRHPSTTYGGHGWRGPLRLLEAPVLLVGPLYVLLPRSSTVEVAASPPAVRLWPELAFQPHQAPDPGAVGAEVGLDGGGRLTDGGQVDAQQLRAPLQRRRDRPAQVRVVPSPHLSSLSNRCSRPNRECYLPRPDGPLGHIGGTEPRPARVNSGQSWKGNDLVDGSFRCCAPGRESGRLALLRQRFGVRVPGGAPEEPPKLRTPEADQAQAVLFAF